ncbi:hypothetical protein JHK86_039608 [Glycine max]|nr:hypothetical protein JHK86_039608 [Glycine max]
MHIDGGTTKVLLAACTNEDQTEQVTTVIRTMHKDMKTLVKDVSSKKGTKGTNGDEFGSKMDLKEYVE